ncbi:hypothetical protein N1031_19860 [Herbiconiux moechotypicola]|uniref:PucR family transcriptional regulator n=1 Tax=Herbiconiux moechotypicola TaxID=637393 RepID=A0ABN3E6R9_9MICO|nr:hypothetical protein [Herbiconiux moechotypicola]MCS5732018.1 hypothetical protein [Herbiconiux moechotypicola]
MQELLGRLTALDPAASQSLRVIACFDELIAGDVGVHGLLSAAAALSGRPVGLIRGRVVTRIDPRGEPLESSLPPAHVHRVFDDVAVWIEDAADDTTDLDAIILERLALALLIRLDTKRTSTVPPRDMSVLLDRSTPGIDRREVAARLGLAANGRFRVVAAPLFATWTHHPRGPEDVVATPFGPVHAAVVAIDATPVASPLGIGSIAAIDDIDRSFRTAMIALRLHGGSSDGPSRADDLGGLAEMLADLPDDRREDGDQAAVELVTLHKWGASTIDALVRAGSLREAARIAGVHHSTMTDRTEIITATLGFDPMSGIGRTRLGLAFLRWRLRTSRVLEFTPAS